MKRTSAIIEFIGFSGSGKTFISRHLRDELGAGCILISDVHFNALDVLSYSLTHPLSIIDTILFIKSTKQPNRALAFEHIKSIVKYTIRLHKSSKIKHKYVLIDEGMLHKLRNIRSTSTIKSLPYEDIRPRYRRQLFSKADIVLHVDAPIETIAYRRLKRKHMVPGLAELTNHIARIRPELEKRAKETLRDIEAAEAERRFQCIKIYNDDNKPPENMIQYIKGRLSQLES